MHSALLLEWSWCHVLRAASGELTSVAKSPEWQNGWLVLPSLQQSSTQTGAERRNCHRKKCKRPDVQAARQSRSAWRGFASSAATTTKPRSFGDYEQKADRGSCERSPTNPMTFMFYVAISNVLDVAPKGVDTTHFKEENRALRKGDSHQIQEESQPHQKRQELNVHEPHMHQATRTKLLAQIRSTFCFFQMIKCGMSWVSSVDEFRGHRYTLSSSFVSRQQIKNMPLLPSPSLPTTEKYVEGFSRVVPPITCQLGRSKVFFA